MFQTTGPHFSYNGQPGQNLGIMGYFESENLRRHHIRRKLAFRFPVPRTFSRELKDSPRESEGKISGWMVRLSLGHTQGNGRLGDIPGEEP